MNLAQMRASLAAKVGLGESDFSEADLDRALNQIWRYAIPDRLSGATVRGLRTFATVAGQDTYDLDVVFPGEIRAAQCPVVLATGRLAFYSDPAAFWADYDAADTAQGTPTGVLASGRRLVLRPTPNAVLSVYVQCLSYRAALTADGIADDREAGVVLAGAAELVALDLGMDDIASRMNARHETGIGQLVHKYSAGAEADPVALGDF